MNKKPVLIGIAIFVAITAGIYWMLEYGKSRKLSLEEEHSLCEEIRRGFFMKDGADGKCELYLGEDKEDHYRYVKHSIFSSDGDVVMYYDWKTLKRIK